MAERKRIIFKLDADDLKDACYQYIEMNPGYPSIVDHFEIEDLSIINEDGSTSDEWIEVEFSVIQKDRKDAVLYQSRTE